MQKRRGRARRNDVIVQHPQRALRDNGIVATPSTPRETAFENLRNSDVMILLIGFKAGSLLADGSGSTYTSAEYDELLRLGKEPLVFVRQKKQRGQTIPTWRNQERTLKKRKALDDFKASVGEKWTWDYFTTPDQLALGVIHKPF